MRFNTFRFFLLTVVSVAFYLWVNDDSQGRLSSRKARQVDTVLGKGFCPDVLNAVVITYDEGPSVTHTDNLLNNLQTVSGKVVLHVNPTWLNSNQALQLKISRAYSEGHQIGLRWRTTLDESLATMSVDDFMQQLINDATFIGSILKLKTVPRFVRFPQGQLTAAQAAAASAAGFISTYWGIDSGDYSQSATVDSVVSAYTSRMDNVTSPQFRGSLIALNRDLYAVAANAAVSVQKTIVKYNYSIITLDACFKVSAYFTPNTTVAATTNATSPTDTMTESTPTSGAINAVHFATIISINVAVCSVLMAAFLLV